MKKQFLLLILIALSVCACKKNETGGSTNPPAVDSAGFSSFKIEAKNNTGKVTSDVNCTITGDSIIAVVPEMTTNNKWVVTFDTKKAGTNVKANDTLSISGNTVTDFSKPVIYSLTSATGQSKNYTVKVKVFTGLPIFYITTDRPVISKDDYVNGVLSIDANAEYEQPVTRIPLQMKGVAIQPGIIKLILKNHIV